MNPKPKRLKTIAYRLTVDMIERIDAYASQNVGFDGRPVDRSTAIRKLLETGLATEAKTGERTPNGPEPPEVITGKITDTFESPPNKKKKTSIDAYAAKRAAAFEEAKKKRPGV